MLAAADLSLYGAEDKGGDRLEFYTPDPAWRKHLQASPGWAERLARALAQERLVAYAQPILDLRSGQLSRYELLVRLAEPSPLVEPAVFLPVALDSASGEGVPVDRSLGQPEHHPFPLAQVPVRTPPRVVP